LIKPRIDLDGTTAAARSAASASGGAGTDFEHDVAVVELRAFDDQRCKFKSIRMPALRLNRLRRTPRDYEIV
jgi:hypothetical protein